MSDDRRRPSAADVPHKVRDALDVLGRRANELQEDIQEDPGRVWRSPVLRIAIWAILAIAAYFLIRFAIGAFAPPTPGGNIERATPTATLNVACTNPDCRSHYTSKQPMDFKGWPLTCEKCKQPTVYRAKLCKSCRTWYAVAPGQRDLCFECEARAKAASKPSSRATSKPTGDDSEDGW